MASVNYIQHQIAFFKKVYDDDRLSPYHISLYMALFQFWNSNRFQNTFSAARSDLMQISKVKSKTTYSKCLHELSEWKYIEYYPSTNPFVKSSFNLTIKWTSLGPAPNTTSPFNGLPLVQPSPSNGLVLVPDKTYKHKPINIKEKPSSEIHVINFFKNNQSSKIEGQKFWNHYESNGWQIGKAKMVDWEAAARKWILNQNDKNNNQLVQQMDYLQTSKNKDYGKPL